jgi:adenylosuccinate synthase
MPANVIIGAQWGDEGKGKIADYLAEDADIVVRFQGGNNAGHTIKIEDETYKLHLIPAGILRADKIAALGNGVVLDPGMLIGEIDGLEKRGISTAGLRISGNAHVIMPYHIALDHAEEEGRSSKDSIGTTRRGIGPCYADKAARHGVRVQDLFSESRLRAKVIKALAPKAHILGTSQRKGIDVDVVVSDYLAYGQRLQPFVCDVSRLLLDALDAGQKVLCEGAQGVGLDVDHGAYPFVTSSNCLPAAAGPGAGIPPQAITEVFGIVKAYPTRIDTVGPFPSKFEVDGELNQLLVEHGHEYGTTTGRRRRCGWLDAVALRHAARLSGMTQLIMTKLDILSALDELKICVAYRTPEGEVIDHYPYDHELLDAVEPIFEDLHGFDDLSQACSYEELPEAAKVYVKRTADLVGVPVTKIGVGQGREQILDVPEDAR